MISSLVTSSPADRARTSTMSKARLPNGTGIPCVRSSRRVRSISHGPGSLSNRRRCAANPVTPAVLLGNFRILKFLGLRQKNFLGLRQGMNAVEQKMIAHLEVSHVISILARSRPRHVHSYGMLTPTAGPPTSPAGQPGALKSAQDEPPL